MPKISQARIKTYYNKLVIIFCAIALIIVCFTIYFALAKTTISIEPDINPNISMEASIIDLDGEKKNIVLDDYFVYSDLPVSGEKQEDFATGTVTIYNNTNNNQPLVATTRLLSENDKLFRTSTDVVVPANGEVEVAVKADEKGESGNIGPSEFEIVALNDSKKEFIYAKSSEAMAGGVANTVIITEEDIQKAKKAAADSLIKAAADEFSKTIQDVDENNIGLDSLDQFTEVKAGDSASAIPISSKANIAYLTFNPEKINDACGLALAKKNTANFEITYAKKQSTEYKIREKYGQTIVAFECAGTVSIKPSAPVNDKDKYKNKTDSQIKKFVSSFPEIKNVSVDFSPFWLKTAPLISNNINIKINI